MFKNVLKPTKHIYSDSAQVTRSIIETHSCHTFWQSQVDLNLSSSRGPTNSSPEMRKKKKIIVQLHRALQMDHCLLFLSYSVSTHRIHWEKEDIVGEVLDQPNSFGPA